MLLCHDPHLEGVAHGNDQELSTRRYAALWVTMQKYNISANLIRVIKYLYDMTTSAVLLNGSIGDWFRTTVGVRQECLLSPTLFNIFLEKIMTDALKDHEDTVSTWRHNNHQSPLC